MNKTIFTFLILILIFAKTTAQNTFQEIIDSSLSISDALISSDGYLIIGSNYPVYLTLFERAANLTKLNLDGDVVWSKSYVHDTWYDSPKCAAILQTIDSGFVIGGGVGAQVTIIHTDKNGNLMWSKKIASNGSDFCNSIIASSDGGVIYCGRIIDNYANNSDACIVKINESGDVMWSYSYSEAIMATDIVEASDGGFLVLGYGLIDTTFFAHYMIFKIDITGNVLWSKTFADSMGIYDLVALEDGFAGCGYKHVSDNHFAALMLEFDNEGNMLWIKQFDFGEYCYAESITVTDDNKFLLGCFGSSLIKCDFIGNLEWAYQYGDSLGAGSPQLSIPIQAPDGNYFFCGINGFPLDVRGGLVKTTDKGVSFCNERSLLPNSAPADIQAYSTSLTRADLSYFSEDYPLNTVIDTLETVVLCTNVGTPTLNQEHKLLLFPNPFTSLITINYSLQEYSTVSIDVFNLFGQNVKTIVRNEKQAGGQHQYDFSGVGNGIYFVKLTVDGISSSKKIIQFKSIF